MDVNSNHSYRSFPPIRYLLVLWLFVMSAVAFLDRTNISIAGVHISREYAVDNTRLGWVFSAFLIGYAIFQVPAGLLARRIGPRYVLSLGMVWCGVFATLTALVPPTLRGAMLVLALVRFGLGVGEATMYPAASQFVERWFPVGERGKANGFVFAGVGVGAGLTPPLVTAIILRHGWRAAFWFSAVIDVAVSLVWCLAARDSPEEHPFVGDAEKTLIGGKENQSSPSIVQGEPTRDAKRLDSLGEDPHEQGGLRPDLELFCVRLCCLDILRMVLHLYGASARAQPQDQRRLLHVAIHRHDDRLPRGRCCERLDRGPIWPACGPMPVARSFARTYGDSSGDGIARSQRGFGRSDSCLLRGRPVHLSERLLGCLG